MNKSNDYNGTTTAESTIDYKVRPETCPYRLPCGYCRMLMRDCPKYYTYTTTWTSGNPNIKVTL